ncbi:MAG: acyl-CoA thioester hydrolase [Zhongshania sp.]|jgi:acyl-CoA thioester hydrolase
MKLPHTRVEIQVRFSDLDINGHVSNSYYAQYFDLARMSFFKEVDRLSAATSPTHVVASVKMDMLHEIRFDQQVFVDTWCSRMGNKSMTIEHFIYANGEKVTTCQTVLVGFDRNTRSSSVLPSDWEASDTSLVLAPATKS